MAACSTYVASALTVQIKKTTRFAQGQYPGDGKVCFIAILTDVSMHHATATGSKIANKLKIR